MNILIELCHPAQFYYYKHTMLSLKKHGHNIFVLIKSKDILEQLLIESKISYTNILKNDNRRSKLGYFLDMALRDWRVLIFCLRHRIDLLTGSSPEVSHIGWLLRKHSINIGEDDATIIPKYVKVCYPFLDTRITPMVCNNGIMEKKAIKFDGYWKLAYLHPNVFVPRKEIVNKYISTEKPYFLLRFAKLCAHHDNGINGIDTDLAIKIVSILEDYGNVYISSERSLPEQLDNYKIHINPLHVHHIMAFASIYIGDSQSMAVEAAMLGTPSIRFNSFAGKISVLEELQNVYHLTCGIHDTEPERLIMTIRNYLSTPNLKEIFQKRRMKMLTEKIDVAAFFTWFIEHYPNSKTVMHEHPSFQYKFRVNK